MNHVGVGAWESSVCAAACVLPRLSLLVGVSVAVLSGTLKRTAQWCVAVRRTHYSYTHTHTPRIARASTECTIFHVWKTFGVPPRRTHFTSKKKNIEKWKRIHFHVRKLRSCRLMAALPPPPLHITRKTIAQFTSRVQFWALNTYDEVFFRLFENARWGEDEKKYGRTTVLKLQRRARRHLRFKHSWTFIYFIKGRVRTKRWFSLWACMFLRSLWPYERCSDSSRSSNARTYFQCFTSSSLFKHKFNVNGDK